MCIHKDTLFTVAAAPCCVKSRAQVLLTVARANKRWAYDTAVPGNLDYGPHGDATTRGWRLNLGHGGLESPVGR